MDSFFKVGNGTVQIAKQQQLIKQVENRGFKVVNNDIEYFFRQPYKANAGKVFQQMIEQLKHRVKDQGINQQLDLFYMSFLSITSQRDEKMFDSVDRTKHVIHYIKLGYQKNAKTAVIAYMAVALSFQTMPILVKISNSSSHSSTKTIGPFSSSKHHSESSQAYVEVARGIQADDQQMIDRLLSYGSENVNRMLAIQSTEEEDW